jgi:hypothetical protein
MGEVMNWEEINHFEEWEFECPCCKKADMNASFVKLLDKARTIAGVSFVLTSGYRWSPPSRGRGLKPII